MLQQKQWLTLMHCWLNEGTSRTSLSGWEAQLAFGGREGHGRVCSLLAMGLGDGRLPSRGTAELLKPVFRNHLEYFIWHERRFLPRAKAGFRSTCMSVLLVLTSCLAAEASFRARSLLLCCQSRLRVSGLQEVCSTVNPG